MLLEAVPNVSEGRDPARVRHLADACARGGASLLHTSSDPSHHRSVLTVAGSPAALAAAMLDLVEAAVATIDLRTHDGEHPRLGAVDVMPFVPLAGASMSDAVALAREVGAAVAVRFGLPVYLYEEAAPAPHRRRLDQLRAGGLPGLSARMSDPGWQPDFGPHRPHPSAGVLAVGARRPLVAFNVNLATTDRAIAAAIARTVRGRDGGLPGLKALPMTLGHRGRAQVSMNLVNLEQTTVADAFDAVCRAAAALGVGIAESEVVGLLPQMALGGRTPADLRIEHWSDDLLLETQLTRAGLTA